MPFLKLFLKKVLNSNFLLITSFNIELLIMDEVIKSMLFLNKDAATLAQMFDVSAMTDVTGFGLAGHCLEMAKSSDVKLVFLPIFIFITL